MKIFKEEQVTSINLRLMGIVCDRCGKEIDHHDFIEMNEMYCIRVTGGYGSVFGDMVDVECDLCQHCLYELIKDCYRVTNIGGNDETFGEGVPAVESDRD